MNPIHQRARHLPYSKRRYLQFYRAFDRFQMKCFLHRALLYWGYAPPICVIDNTNLARLRGLGAQAVIVPEMEAFAKAYGFRFLCHARGHSDRKAGEERSFLTTETNFLPGRTFDSLEDLNQKALAWSTERMEQRPQGKAGLIPAKAFEHERGFLQELPPHLPAPYKVLERSVDEYGYVAVEANYYWVPGTGRGEVMVLRYDTHCQIYQSGQCLMEYPLALDGVRNKQVNPLGQPVSPYKPRHRKLPSQEEEKRLRALAPAVSAYVDFILAAPGLLRHQYLRRLFVISPMNVRCAYAVLFVTLLWAGCGRYFAPDINLRRCVSGKEIVGVWSILPTTLALAKRGGYSPTEGGPHEVLFREDGTCDFQSITELDGKAEYHRSHGSWRLEHDTGLPSERRRKNEVAVNLDDNGRTRVVTLYLTEESGRLLLWFWWGDPDSWEFIKYEKKG